MSVVILVLVQLFVELGEIEDLVKKYHRDGSRTEKRLIDVLPTISNHLAKVLLRLFLRNAVLLHVKLDAGERLAMLLLKLQLHTGNPVKFFYRDTGRMVSNIAEGDA